MTIQNKNHRFLAGLAVSFYFCSMRETVVLQDLTIGYATKKKDDVVAAHLDASLQEGELTCLIGSNGIGKSTLLKTLAGFQPPLAGNILLKDKPLKSYSNRELARQISVVLTGRPDVEQLAVMEMVGLGRSPYTGFWGTLRKEDRQVAEEAMRQVGIYPLRDCQFATLSDGERQKVMIAKALAQQTPVIFLDEPTAFLDFPSKVEMLLLLRSLAHDLQKTLFLSTHDVELALRLADKLWLMLPEGQGTSLHIGTPSALAAGDALRRYIERSNIRFDAQNLTVKILE